MTVLMGENLKNEKTFHEPVIFSTFHGSQWTLWNAAKKYWQKIWLYYSAEEKKTDRPSTMEIRELMYEIKNITKRTTNTNGIE